ncbi:hypothetical protein Tco_1145711 [Tanacetum coccineum]
MVGLGPAESDHSRKDRLEDVMMFSGLRSRGVKAEFRRLQNSCGFSTIRDAVNDYVRPSKGRGCDNEGYIVLGDEVGSVVDMASVVSEVAAATSSSHKCSLTTDDHISALPLADPCLLQGANKSLMANSSGPGKYEDPKLEDGLDTKSYYARVM